LAEFAPSSFSAGGHWQAGGAGNVGVDFVPAREEPSSSWPSAATFDTPQPVDVSQWHHNADAEPLRASDWPHQFEQPIDDVKVSRPAIQSQDHSSSSFDTSRQSLAALPQAETQTAGLRHRDDQYEQLESMPDTSSPSGDADFPTPASVDSGPELLNSFSADIVDLRLENLHDGTASESGLGALLLPMAIAIVCIAALFASISSQNADQAMTQLQYADEDDVDMELVDVDSHCAPLSTALPLGPSSFHAFAAQNGPAAQVGCWYIARIGGEERVVRIVSLGGSGTTAWAAPCEPFWQQGSSRLAFRKERADAAVELPMQTLEAGPFQLIGGKPPPFIAERLERSHGTCEAGWQDPSAGKARLIEEPYGARHADQIKSKLGVGSGRFRYGAALRKMQEMGFEDTPDLRKLVTKHEGRVPGILRQLEDA